MKWIKFSDQWPECRWIWIYTTQVVELVSEQDYEKSPIRTNITTHPDWKWADAEIVYPAPPEKEKHYCREFSIECGENIHGDLWVRNSDLNHPPLTSFRASFCPFCGFTLEKK